MIFNTQAAFLRPGSEEVYDPVKGEYIPADNEKTYRLGNISDLGIVTNQTLFGNYLKDRKVLIIQVPYTDEFTHIEVEGLRYKAVSVRQNSTVFYLEEDNING